MKRYYQYVSLIILLLSPFAVSAQSGGSGVYAFLKLSNSARITALGGNIASLYDDDLNTVYYNPSLLNKDMHGSAVLNYVHYFAGINFGYLAYSHHHEKYGSFAAGLHYLNYGDFIEADAAGNIIGSFSAADYALNLMWAKEWYPGLSMGINIKPIYSHLEKYSSFGLVSDIGLTWHNDEKQFAASATLKNIGGQITTYHDDNREPVESDLTIGFSKRLAHAPFRFNLTFHHLLYGNLMYDTQEDNRINIYEEPEDEPKIDIQELLDNGLRHVIVGVEFIPFKNFYAALGYNHLRRAEMGITDLGGFAGISWGFGIKLKRFGLSYGRASYHKAGGSNHFSVYYRFTAKESASEMPVPAI